MSNPSAEIEVTAKRLFFAIDLLPQTREEIAHWQQHIQPANTKVVAADNLHITLAFLGLVTPEQQQTLTDYAHQLHQEISPKICQLHSNHLALFKKPQVLYLGFRHFPLDLHTLALKLSAKAGKLGLFQENRAYLPHLSLFRKAKFLPNIASKSFCITITSFSLYHSQSTANGVCYHKVKTWPLSSN